MILHLPLVTVHFCRPAKTKSDGGAVVRSIPHSYCSASIRTDISLSFSKNYILCCILPSQSEGFYVNTIKVSWFQVIAWEQHNASCVLVSMTIPQNLHIGFSQTGSTHKGSVCGLDLTVWEYVEHTKYNLQQGVLIFSTPEIGLWQLAVQLCKFCMTSINSENSVTIMQGLSRPFIKYSSASSLFTQILDFCACSDILRSLLLPSRTSKPDSHSLTKCDPSQHTLSL